MRSIYSKMRSLQIRILMLCWPLVFLMCDQYNVAEMLSSENKFASAQINVSVNKIATLAKQQSINLKHLVLTLESMGEDIIHDTVDFSGTGGSNIITTINNLKAPRQWRVTVASYDQSDSIVHYGFSLFNTKPADTVDVALTLESRYSMFRVSFNGIPDSAQDLLLIVDGIIKADSNLTTPGNPDTVVLSYDYLTASSTGVNHTVSLRIRGKYFGTETVLFAVDTALVAKSGENKTHNVTCKWTGPLINNPPVFESEVSDMLDSVYVNAIYRDTLYGNDEDGDGLSYSLITKPAAMTISGNIINWNPVISDTGTHSISATVNDGRSGSDTLSWTVRVKATPAGNHAPVIASVSADMLSSIKVDSQYVDTIHATDADGDTVNFEFLSNVAGMEIHDSIIIWTPAINDIGNKSISVIVRDIFGGSDTLSWNITVLSNLVYPLIPFDAVVTGEVNPGTDIDHYQFYGTSGDRISLRVKPTSSVTSRVQIVSPTGIVLINKSVINGIQNSIENLYLPTNGIYTIRIMENSGNTAYSYDMSLNSNQYTRTNAGTISFGNNISDSLSSRIEMHSYLFSGISGDRVSLRVKPAKSVTSRVQIVSSNDSVLIDKSVINGLINFIEDLYLPTSSLYTIRIMENSGNAEFSYDMSLNSNQYTRANAGIVSIGNNITDSLSFRLEMKCYLFSGASGDKVSLRVKPTSSVTSRVQIVSSTDSVLVNKSVINGLLNSIEDLYLPTTGVYTIRIMENSGTANFKFTLGLF